MEYYFTERENVRKDKLFILGEESEHLFKVLRRRGGEEIYVTDGEYNVYKCVIEDAGKYKIECSISEKFHKLNEPEIKIHLYPSLLRNHDRFEFIIEKAVEIGVHEITPVISYRVINKEWNKRERWQAIAMAAMKQSQRCFLPYVNEPTEMKTILSEASPEAINIIGHENEKRSGEIAELQKLVMETNECSIFAGPEGGYSEEEIELAAEKKFRFIKLGNRKMRSETAAIIMSSLMLFGKGT